MTKTHVIRLSVGIIGNITSLLLYAAPTITFWRVIKRKSTERFSCVPYVIALFNCWTYTWYGLPVVSDGWENFLVATVNGVGIFLEFFFICAYLIFAPPKAKRRVASMVAVALVLFSASAAASSFALHDHKSRKMMIGMVGFASSVAMYGSPLLIMKLVIQTKSVEFMPFYLSFFSFLTSSLWMAYGLLGRDLFLAAPNLVGSPLGLAQLALYCIYRKRRAPTENGMSDAEIGLKSNGSLNGIYNEKPKLPIDQKLDLQKKASQRGES